MFPLSQPFFSMGLFFYCSVLRRYVYGAFPFADRRACPQHHAALCSPLSLGQLATSAVRRCRSAHRRPVFHASPAIRCGHGQSSAANRDFTCLWSYHRRHHPIGAIYRHVLRTRRKADGLHHDVAVCHCGAGADGDSICRHHPARFAAANAGGRRALYAGVCIHLLRRRIFQFWL